MGKATKKDQFKPIPVPASTDLTKSNIESLSAQLIQPFTDGWVDAIELDLKLSFIVKAIEEARGKLKPNVISEVEQNKIAEKFGVKVAKRNGYDVYDYDKDPVISEYNQKIDARKELVKMAIKNKEGVVTDSDGAVIEKVPVKNSIGDSVSYTFK